MPFDWAVQQLRLSLFSNEAIPVSETDWKTITDQDEAETRTAIPNGKQYSGKFLGGILTIAYSGLRCDIVLNVDDPVPMRAEVAEARPTLPCIGEWNAVLDVFEEKVTPVLDGLNSPIVRIAFGSVLLSQSESREHAYEKLGELLASVDVDGKNSRELIYRINWPKMSEVIPDLELNRITGWSSVNFRPMLVQLQTGGEMAVSSSDVELYTVRLEMDHNTAAQRKTAFEKAHRMPIFRELVTLARSNAKAGERP